MATPLVRTLTAAVRNLGHRVHMNAWALWRSRGLSATQRRILELLAANPERNTLSAIAEQLGASVATACDSVGALRAKGLISRERHPVDNRAVALQLTSAGQKRLAELALLDDPLETAVCSLSRNEQAIYRELTLKVLEGMRAAEAEAIEKEKRVDWPPNRAGSNPRARPRSENSHAQADSARG